MEITIITSNIKPYESGIVQSSQHRKGRRKKNELFYSSVIKKYLIKEGTISTGFDSFQNSPPYPTYIVV